MRFVHIPSPESPAVRVRPALFLLCGLSLPAVAGPPAYPVVARLEPAAEVPARTLAVENRGGWIVVTLTVEPAAAEIGAEAGDEPDGGAFGDSADAPPLEAVRPPEEAAAFADLAAGGLEWAVILAAADPAVAPVVDADADRGTVAVQYGPYFVREAGGRLRVVRQPKPAPADGGPPAWALAEAPTVADWAGAVAGPAVRVVGLKRGGWYWTLSQPRPTAAEPLELPADVFVRLAPLAAGVTEGGERTGGAVTFSTDPFGDGPAAGETADEGDLLLARRTPLYAPAETIVIRERIAARKAAREALIGTAAPPLDAAYLTAAGGPTEPPIAVDLAALRGQVVLLDFWGTWCGPCVAALPKVAALHERFGDRGLTIVGVHSPLDSDELPAFLEDRDLPFPLALAGDRAVADYGVSFWPTYYLIGRDGAILRPPSSAVPTADDIEAALVRPAQ